MKSSASWKKATKLTTVAVLATSLFFPLTYPVSAAVHHVQEQISSRTEQEIMKKWQQYLPQHFNTEQIFDTVPQYTAPHRAGKLKDSVLQDALNATNFARYLAGLPDDVTLDYSIAEQQQAGAVLMSELGYLNHTPDKPAGMADEFYQLGYNAASSSNLSAGRDSLYETVFFGYMSDSSGSNPYSVGHRRWIINPPMKKTMFGLAYKESSTYRYYSTMHAFNRDRSIEEVQYEYLAWPSAGLFPTDVLGVDDPWSVSLNPTIYDRNKTDEIYVTMSRESDKKSWKLDAGDKEMSGDFLSISTAGYGINFAVIFHPEEIGRYVADDTYHVTIHNLYTAAGEKTSLTYDTTLFNLQASYKNNELRYALVDQKLKFPVSGNATRYLSSDPDIASVDQNGVVTAHKAGAVDIVVDNYLLNYDSMITLIVEEESFYPISKWAVSSIIKANEYGILNNNPYYSNPGANVTREQFVSYVTGMLKALDPTIDYEDYYDKPSAFSDVGQSDYEITWAYEQGIISGTGQGKFSPNATITREQAATLLLNVYKYLGGNEQPAAVSPFADQSKISSWAKQAVKQAAELAIMGGLPENRFDPQGKYTHEQTIATLLRLYLKFAE